MKATKAEISRRVEEVLRLRLDGAEFHDVVQYAAEQGWNVRERQLWNYVRASDKLLARRLEKDRDKLLARHVAQRRALYARAVHAADYRTALAVARDEAALQGLYPPKKIAHTDPTGEECHAPALSDAECVLAIQAIYARVGVRGPGPPLLGPVPGDGSLSAGAGAADDRRRPDARPVAAEPAADAGVANAAALFPPGR
jgi:hypothetical protein